MIGCVFFKTKHGPYIFFFLILKNKKEIEICERIEFLNFWGYETLELQAETVASGPSKLNNIGPRMR